MPADVIKILPITVAPGKNVTFNNTLTFSGTDGSTLNIGTGGTLGTAAYQNIGTSGANVPLMSTANTWAALQIFTGVGAAGIAASINSATGINNNPSVLRFTGTDGAGNLGTPAYISSSSGLGILINPRLRVTDGAGPSAGNVVMDIQSTTGQFFTAGTERFGYDATGFYTGTTASKGRFSVVGGKTARMVNGGTFTLVAGAQTIPDISITANSHVVITLKTVGGTIAGQPFIDTITPTTGFTVTGGGGSNTSTYNYAVFELA